ncbi:hypothetical protein [Rhizobium leguminosarum]|uniref:hypothetical protein n=1 Tax=Rhizobium leguminosarum TaxID=384 RepID=UPI001FED5FC5|nr:hypothetical protein [Rhizobium leguminosarum]
MSGSQEATGLLPQHLKAVLGGDADDIVSRQQEIDHDDVEISSNCMLVGNAGMMAELSSTGQLGGLLKQIVQALKRPALPRRDSHSIPTNWNNFPVAASFPGNRKG